MMNGRTAANYGPYSAPRYGASGYGSYGSYASPYSRFGGNVYGGMGGYGGGMYGLGPYGGMPPNPNDPNSLTNTLGQSTQTTFQIIESIVGAFANFSQMLESTYMATHSSFFGMPPYAGNAIAGRASLTGSSPSHGLRGRAVWESAKHDRLDLRRLCAAALAAVLLLKNKRSSRHAQPRRADAVEFRVL